MSNKDPLAELNEHFARFMQHADGLLREWKSAIEEQTVDLQGRVEREVDSHLDKSVRQSLAQLRAEMDRLTARRPGSAVSAVPQPEARSRSLIMGALMSANVLLLILVGFQVKSCAGGEDGEASGAEPGGLPPFNELGGKRVALDAGLRGAPPRLPTPDAAAVVVVDAAVPDAAPKKKATKKKKSSKKKSSKKKASKKRKKSAK